MHSLNPFNIQLLRNIVGFYVTFRRKLKKNKNFQAKSKFTQAVLSIIANQIVWAQDKEEMMHSFKTLDMEN